MDLNVGLARAKFEAFKKAFTSRVLIAHQGGEGVCYHWNGCCICFNALKKGLAEIYSDFYPSGEKKIRTLELQDFKEAPSVFDTKSARIFALELWCDFNQIPWEEILTKEGERGSRFWNHYYCPMEGFGL